MKCNQCGKSVESACKRDDCGINVQTIKAELRRQDLAMRRATDVKLAESEFQQNYQRVARHSGGGGGMTNENERVEPYCFVMLGYDEEHKMCGCYPECRKDCPDAARCLAQMPEYQKKDEK